MTSLSEALFAEWSKSETIIRSALDGTMGETVEEGESAAAILGDFAFFAGVPNKKLILVTLSEREFLIAVPQNEAWERCIENTLGESAKRVTRFAFRKDTAFDREHLSRLSERVPAGFRVRRIDEDMYLECKRHDFSKDFVANFASFREYERHGVGFVAIKGEDGSLAAGASSYSAYKGGIEIEIDTHPDSRRRGLAECLAARLIVECLDRGIYPSWDAQNKVSAHLAERLGYVPCGEYTAYEVRR